eukprot:1141470-Pelagomonas_calceolata.AAC.6
MCVHLCICSPCAQSIHSSEHLAALANSTIQLGHPAEIALKWINVPLGSVRVSLGYMSTFEDSYALVDFIRTNYFDRQLIAVDFSLCAGLARSGDSLDMQFSAPCTFTVVE